MLPAASVDLVVTNPPYRDRFHCAIANSGHPERILGAFSDVYRVPKPDTFRAREALNDLVDWPAQPS